MHCARARVHAHRDARRALMDTRNQVVICRIWKHFEGFWLDFVGFWEANWEGKRSQDSTRQDRTGQVKTGQDKDKDKTRQYFGRQRAAADFWRRKGRLGLTDYQGDTSKNYQNQLN